MNLTVRDLHDLELIQQLLDEAYEHYFEHSDGHCKSAEGVITLESPTYWDYVEGKWRVSIYSYVLGPGRQNHFPSIQAALAAVREWHRAEMSHDYSEDLLPL